LGRRRVCVFAGVSGAQHPQATLCAGIAEGVCVQRGGEAGETAKGERRVAQLAAHGMLVAR
jgi:hypothetical protein